MERLLERSGHLRGLEHGHRHLGERRRDGGNIDGLEVLLVQPRHRGLAGDAQDRDRVGRCGVQPGDHVGACRSGRADADADVAGDRSGVALGHVRGALDVAGEDMADAAVVLHRRVERVDRGAREAEDGVDALLLQDGDCGVDGAHAWHGTYFR